ncbi:helicase-associated domain-containing protein [Microlunatus sp. GCM10028923]|uniref:helicase-associated domain-containing protein n=1 Tax=Microlunatus sp. GCM10028923 TaxID=3273400 RepID=UPI003618370E
MVLTTPADRPRTLAEALRAGGRDFLVRLIELRPDLGYPLPADLAELAGRAATTTSTVRILDRLDAWTRLVAEILAALPDPTTPDRAAELAAGSVADLTDPSEVAAAVDRAIATLRDRALLWATGPPQVELRLTRAVREYFGPYPGGLAPPSPQPLDPGQVTDRLAAAGPDEHDVLAKLAHSPAGAVRNADRPVSLEQAATPIDRLLARGLIRPLSPETVILPREIAWRLREGRFAATPVAATAPPVGGRHRDASVVDRAAAGAAYGLLEDVVGVAAVLEEAPHRLVRDGGVASRDLTQLARALGTDLAQTAFVVELGAAADLYGTGGGNRLLPTTGYDRWVGEPLPDRWLRLVRAWLIMERYPGRELAAGQHALGPELAAPAAPAARSLIMELMRAADTGTVLDHDQLAAAVGWHRPRLGAAGQPPIADLTGWIWREAGYLGLTGLGAVSGFGAALESPDAALPEPLAGLFPALVDSIIVQADLTAVAAGPLPVRLAEELRLLAVQESRGGAGVYRFSADSLRRAFDAGWTAERIHDWLSHHSATAIPQPLGYLVDDVARQYGSIRIGPATSYLRVDDEARARTILSHPGAAQLGLRRLGPGVLIAAAEPYQLVEFVRELGFAPAAEDEYGRNLAPPDRLRATVFERVRPPGTARPTELADAILAGDRGRDPDRVETAELLTRLNRAARNSSPVLLGYVGPDGDPVERRLTPVDLGEGVLRAVLEDDSAVLRIPLSRVSSVIPLQ